MRDKTAQIVEAALRVFLKKGYKDSTTQEIAREADVAEVTLFRKFENKQNLFSSVIKPIVAHQFNTKVFEKGIEEDSEVFIKHLVDDRLLKISKNRQVFRMLMAESIVGTLEAEIDLPNILHSELKKVFNSHFNKLGLSIDTEEMVGFLGGIFMSHLLWPRENPYHKLGKNQRLELIDKYYEALKPLMNFEKIQ